MVKGANLEVWHKLDTDEKVIKKRKAVLDKFLADLKQKDRKPSQAENNSTSF